MQRAYVNFTALGLSFEGVAQYNHHDNGAIDLDGVILEGIEATESHVQYAYAKVSDGVWICASEMNPLQVESINEQIATFESERRAGAYNYTREEA